MFYMLVFFVGVFVEFYETYGFVDPCFDENVFGFCLLSEFQEFGGQLVNS